MGLGGPPPAGAAKAAVTSRRCSERACSHRRQPDPATGRKEGTGRSRWYCGKWQEREAGTHLEAPRPRCRASCGGGGHRASAVRGWGAGTAAAPPRAARGDLLREKGERRSGHVARARRGGREGGARDTFGSRDPDLE